MPSQVVKLFDFKAVPVDSTSPLPAYLQLEQDLRRQIRTAAQAYGARLPSEQALARLYGVSRVTLRQALDRLANAGLVSRRQGVGTVITPMPEVTLELKPMASVTDQLRAAGYHTHVRILDQKLEVPTRQTLSALRLSPDESCILVRRLLAAESQSVSIISSWLPQRLFSGLETAELSSTEDSLWATLSTKFGRPPARATNVMEVVSSTVQEAELLQVGFGGPLVRLECIVYDATDQPIEHSTALWVATCVRLHF